MTYSAYPVQFDFCSQYITNVQKCIRVKNRKTRHATIVVMQCILSITDSIYGLTVIDYRTKPISIYIHNITEPQLRIKLLYKKWWDRMSRNSIRYPRILRTGVRFYLFAGKHRSYILKLYICFEVQYDWKSYSWMILCNVTVLIWSVNSYIWWYNTNSILVNVTRSQFNKSCKSCITICITADLTDKYIRIYNISTPVPATCMSSIQQYPYRKPEKSCHNLQKKEVSTLESL